LERAKSKNLVQDLGNHLLAFRHRERSFLALQDVQDDLAQLFPRSTPSILKSTRENLLPSLASAAAEKLR
jgi:hypothetical protein